MNDYEDDEHVPSGCLSCGTDNDETDYEELGDRWRIFCPYCDKTLASGKVADEPIIKEEQGAMDEIKITNRFLDEMGYDLTLGVFIGIMNDYHAGNVTEMQKIADGYNAKHGTSASLEAIASAMQANIDEENRHMNAFFRAMYHEEQDPIGFHEQAFFDNMTKNSEDTDNE